MKIRPYPGKVALVRSQDGVEREVAMNYESSWQECLQLWGSHSNYHHHQGGHQQPANGHYNYATKTLDVVPVSPPPPMLPPPPPPTLNHVAADASFDSYSTDAFGECGTLYGAANNGTVPSHSFNYINNFGGCPRDETAAFAEDAGQACRSYGRQRCCPQMLNEAEASALPTPNGTVAYATAVVNGGLTQPYCGYAANGGAVVDGWTVAENCDHGCAPTAPTNCVVQNGAGAAAVGEQFAFANGCKLYRSPTMLEKVVVAETPYPRENGSVANAIDATAFNVELNASRIPSTDTNGFLIPRPKLIVPVHTYGSRKRRTGNILHSKRRGSDSEPCSSTSTTMESKKHHTSCPGKNTKY